MQYHELKNLTNSQCTPEEFAATNEQKKTMTQEQLDEVLRKHKLWMEDKGGARADLSGADLRGADLRGANLREAVLGDVDLRGAYLRGTYLRAAYLRGADLRGVALHEACLSEAYLRGAKMHKSDADNASLTQKQRSEILIVEED